MALTEETIDDKIEFVGEYRHMQIRTATVIKRDGVEISRTHQRRVLHPDADMTKESAELQRMAAATWTAEIKAAHKAAKRAREDVA